MKFEPTYNYSQTDLDKEENQILWKFGELIKSLITIASDADRQRYVIGIGIVTDEMVLDFESYFTLSYNQYLDNQLLNKDAFDELMLLDDFFEKRSGDKDPDFWDDSLLDINNDWNIARKKAKRILEIMGWNNLDIECEHTDIYNSKHIIRQQTITPLVNKKS
ncbi:hypothetical protein [uncultured Dysgonomonas sp.]|uniref:Uncharacterized protein n=1 Tax=uncultured Dysgonomonas sp. TaxID=206096 RepID=A0A212JTN1_9BACT|nr:hypothetical protein [uncultured Dysgonomonas sp.]SBW02793.1 conserved hypothetical protein [uncultured Dysgonomonas sp.]